MNCGIRDLTRKMKTEGRGPYCAFEARSTIAPSLVFIFLIIGWIKSVSLDSEFEQLGQILGQRDR